MKCTIPLLIGSVLIVASVSAEPYWISYEADDGLFPEQVGWDRLIYGPPAERWFDDGALVIDGTTGDEGADFYRMQLNGNLDPEPGEVFVAEWRIRIDEVSAQHPDPRDPYVEVISDEGWTVTLLFGEDSVVNFFDFTEGASFVPYVWHEFQLRSPDMRSYTVLMDGHVAFVGDFTQSVTPSRMYWGDGGHGATSISRWDYFRFGTVPEPSSGALAVVSVLWLAGRMSTRN